MQGVLLGGASYRCEGASRECVSQCRPIRLTIGPGVQRVGQVADLLQLPQSLRLHLQLLRERLHIRLHACDLDVGGIDGLVLYQHSDERKLSDALEMRGALACECPRHITEMVRALAGFEEYAATCATNPWKNVDAFGLQARKRNQSAMAGAGSIFRQLA
jgi:hypothetical protein